MLVTYIDAPVSVPARMPSPFAPEPHPLARCAAERLQAELRDGLARELGLEHDGKMFGVLVVADRDARVGFLRGFSGMVAGTWHYPAFVPPAFDEHARLAFWAAGEKELAELSARIEEYEEQIEPVRARLQTIVAMQQAELDNLRAQHRANRAERHLARAASSDDELHALGQASRGDRAERRRLVADHAAARAAHEAKLATLEAQRAVFAVERSNRSRDYTQQMFASYSLPNARGETRPLPALFAPHEPPGGAGDCAAPKLLAYAYRHELRPLALAEFWCGATPATGGRIDGNFYPACRGKCGPVLAHMLAGIDHDPAPVFGADAIDPREPLTIFEDAWLAIVDKPVGLLSVPGRGTLTDSVQTRLRARYPSATGPLVVHRLDLDTSGLMVVAKDLITYSVLQQLFTNRAIDKQYVAWLDGEVCGDRGAIDLPLRVDIDDRPRQIVDEVHGKPAFTEWRVLARVDGRTRVALAPKTGRAHQLRVHAAHPRGLGIPIVGDRLYGRPDARLMLHAEAVAFVHPHTHEAIAFHRPAPF